MGEVGVALDRQPRAQPFPQTPPAVKRVQHEPAVAHRHEAGIGTFQAGLRNDHGILRMTTFTMAPIGWVQSARIEPIDDDWGEIVATVELDEARFGADSLRGLKEFSHVDVVYVFHCVGEDSYEAAARRPRGNPRWPEVGVFAQRNKRRPNRIGVCTCELLAVDGAALTVRGLDAIDGTPVLDIKPYMTEFAPRAAVRQPDWSHELMSGYW
jgi:tRNA (adenine37-N6)-methyltransferase